MAGRISDTRGHKPTVLLSGIFVFSAQVLVHAFVGHLYPPGDPRPALGLAAGVGRVGVAALLAVAALASVPAHLRQEEPAHQYR